MTPPATRQRQAASASTSPPSKAAKLPAQSTAWTADDDDDVRTPLLTPKTISFVALISSIFSLIYVWFRHGIFSAWDSLAFRPSDILQGLRPDPGFTLDSDEQAQFAFIAASTHTIIVVAGMLLLTGTRMILRRAPWPARIGPNVRRVAEVLTAAVLSYAFYLVLYTWFTFTFATRRGKPYLWARSFFYEEGEKPFASCASVSYILCLVGGYLIKYSTMESRFSAWPPCVRRYMWSVLAGFFVAFFLFRYAAIPFYRNVTHHLLAREGSTFMKEHEKEFNPNFVALATGTHTLAFVGGMLACFLSRRALELHEIFLPVNESSRIQQTLKVTTYTVWGALVVAAAVGGVVAAADYVRVHWQDLPGPVLHLSHSIWFIWGFLLLAGRVPSLVHGLLSILLSPYHLTKDRPNSLVRRLWRFGLVVSLYNLEKITVVLLTFSIVCAHIFPNFIMAGWTVIILSYMPTYFGTPALTGRRWVPEMRGHFIFNEMAKYFNHRLFTEVEKGELNSDHRYIFGFHPHGVLPISSGIIVNTDLWRNIFTGIDPAPLTSSVLHHVPLMRDFLQFMAGGDVTRGGICATLKRSGSVIFVPGGQQEMINTSSTSNEDVICGSHKGFCRLSMEIAAASEKPVHLVPMFNCGETEILDNLQVPKRWQKASVKALRANIFFFPYGRFGLPGVPRPRDLTTLVAKPILVPRIEKPTKEQVNLLHERYMTAIREAFERFSDEADYSRKTLAFEPEVNRVTEEEWEIAKATFEEVPLTTRDTLEELYSTKGGDRLEMTATAIWWMGIFTYIFVRCLKYTEKFVLDTIFDAV